MKFKKLTIFLLLLCCTFASIRCDNPFQPHVPASLIGKWKLVRNDAMKREGTYDHDSPVGKKCPQFWEIGDKSVVENTTMMEVLCRGGSKCDTLQYCYMKPNSRDLSYVGGSDIKIGGVLYGYKFKNDTLVIIDDHKRNAVQSCCEDIVYYWHYAPYTGAIPPDNSPCARCSDE
jgi:hypothetical protein